MTMSLNMNRKTPIVLLILSLMAGCQSAPSKPAGSSQAAQPIMAQSALLEAPNDDANYFYGAGVGGSQVEAQNDALSKIATRISTSVQAKTQSSLSVESRDQAETINRSFRNQIDTASKKIEFSNIKIIDQKADSKQTQVVVQVSRADLVNNYRDKIKQAHFKLDQDFTLYKKQTAFQKLASQSALVEQVAELTALLKVMDVIQPSYDKRANEQLTQAIYQTLEQHKKSVQFVLKVDNNSKAFADIVSEQLTTQGYTLSQTGQGENVIYVTIKTTATPYEFKTTNQLYANLKMANRTTEYTIKSGTGAAKSITQRTIKTRGVSPESYQKAIQDRKPYQQLLEQKNIINFLANHP